MPIEMSKAKMSSIVMRNVDDSMNRSYFMGMIVGMSGDENKPVTYDTILQIEYHTFKSHSATDIGNFQFTENDSIRFLGNVQNPEDYIKSDPRNHLAVGSSVG